MPVDLTRPLLIFDGDCTFCRRWITRWQHLTAGAIDYEPSQTAGERFPQIPREEFGKSVFFVELDGTATRGAQAVFRSLATVGRYRPLRWLYEHFSPFAWVCEVLYGFIAAHRDAVDRVDRIIVGSETRPATYVLTRGLFLRSMGVIYLIAFLSLFVQIDGLVGSNGILPASNFAAAVTQQYGNARWWIAPSLIFYSASDQFLHGLCITGITASIALIIGIAPMFTTFILWATYLSLATAGQIFLGYQWDALLLEAGFLAILFSPPLWAGSKRRPSRVVLFLMRWLLFRLMFLSALVKWFSGDDSWRNMTALWHHFETQPIPTWTAWHAHFSPHWVLAVGCFCMFVSEGIVPFLYFAPRRTRMLAFWLTVLLQVSIMATGNYGFFNLLTIVLAFSLLDDVAVSRMISWPLKRPCRLIPSSEIDRRRPILRPILVWPASLVVFIVSAMAGIDRLSQASIHWPKPLAILQQYVAPFESTNSYGLFAVMTKDRPELIIEGSNDGVNWKEYAFKWKAGDVDRAPAFCEPHMPRLDWQLWFAAFDPYHNMNWIQNFAFRLLSGQKEVLALLATNPFPDHPPKQLRIVLYDYHFSTPAEHAATGVWWTRKPLRLYMPSVNLSHPGDSADESLRL